MFIDDYVQKIIQRTQLINNKILSMMTGFINNHATELRPFYMHTDNTSLAGLLGAMKADILPVTLNDTAKDAWFAKLLQNQTRYHGCGHIWYQLAYPQQYETDINMVYSVLRAFFNLLWDPSYADFIMYEVVFGTINGHAVVEVAMDQESATESAGRRSLRTVQSGKPTTKTSACADQVLPLIPRVCPNGCISTDAKDFALSKNQEIGPEYDVFPLHTTAVHRHRQFTLIPYFYDLCDTPSVTFEDYFNEAYATSTRQTNVTLEHLKALPGELPYFSIDVTLEDV